MPKYALCAELKESCRDKYIEMHHHATVAGRLRDINRRAGVTKEQIFLYGGGKSIDLVFLYGECEDVAKMIAVLAADGLAATWADECDNTLMKARSEVVETDKFAPLLHVYDMDVLNGVDDVGSGVLGTTRRDLGAVEGIQALAREADSRDWSEASGWAPAPAGVGQPAPPAWNKSRSMDSHFEVEAEGGGGAAPVVAQPQSNVLLQTLVRSLGLLDSMERLQSRATCHAFANEVKRNNDWLYRASTSSLGGMARLIAEYDPDSDGGAYAGKYIAALADKLELVAKAADECFCEVKDKLAKARRKRIEKEWMRKQEELDAANLVAFYSYTGAGAVACVNAACAHTMAPDCELMGAWKCGTESCHREGNVGEAEDTECFTCGSEGWSYGVDDEGYVREHLRLRLPGCFACAACNGFQCGQSPTCTAQMACDASGCADDEERICNSAHHTTIS